jgi:citrate synthase
MEPWRSALVTHNQENIWIQGYEIGALMERASFPAVVFLLHRGRLPSAGEARLLNAILIASADHNSGAPSVAAARIVASGNRQSLSAAVGAGILAIGDEHGGAGANCMLMIARIAAAAKEQNIPLEQASAEAVAKARERKQRLPGFGHRRHTTDPRVSVMFRMAREAGVAGDGVAIISAVEAALTTAVKPLPTNVDGALAALLYDMGFPPDAGKLIFMVGRVAGLTAEVAEEHAREKPMRVRIPVTYDGVPPREMP